MLQSAQLLNSHTASGVFVDVCKYMLKSGLGIVRKLVGVVHPVKHREILLHYVHNLHGSSVYDLFFLILAVSWRNVGIKHSQQQLVHIVYLFFH